MESKENVNNIVFPVYLALTLLFAGALTVLFLRASPSGGESSFTVQTQYGDIAELPESSLVDVNTADAAALEALTGIGPALAQAILEDRAENGPYEAPEDLLRVRGIGEATLQEFSDEISLGNESGADGE